MKSFYDEEKTKDLRDQIRPLAEQMLLLMRELETVSTEGKWKVTSESGDTLRLDFIRKPLGRPLKSLDELMGRAQE